MASNVGTRCDSRWAARDWRAVYTVPASAMAAMMTAVQVPLLLLTLYHQVLTPSGDDHHL